MKLALLTAMTNERAAIAALLADTSTRTLDGVDYTIGHVGRTEVILAATGIGKVNAALGAAALIRAFAPEALVSTGCAGGIDAHLAVMDAVASTSCLYHDVDCGPGNAPGQVQGLPAEFPGDPRLLEAVRKAAPQCPVAVHFGTIATGDRFILERPPLDAIKAAFPQALAVDMESAALAHACHLLKVPFMSLRVVSDTPGAANRFTEYTDFWGTLASRSFGVTRAFLEQL